MNEDLKKLYQASYIDSLQKKEFILNELERTAQIGVCGLDFKDNSIFLSDYITDKLKLFCNKISIESFYNIVHEDYKSHLRFCISNINRLNVIDENFPVCVEDEYIWLRLKIILEDGKASGFIQLNDKVEFENIGEQSSEKLILQDLLFRQSLLSHTLAEFLKNNNTEEVINNILDDILHYFSADRAYIFEFNWKKNSHSCIYEVTTENVSAEIENLQNIEIEQTQWWTERILNNEPIIFNSIEDMPPQAEIDYNEFKRQGIKSMMVIPLKSISNIWGYMGIDMVKTFRNWSDADRIWFSSISNIINICLELYKSQKKANIEKEELSTLYKYMPLGYLRLKLVYNSDGEPCDYTYLDVNSAFELISGEVKSNFIGRNAKDVKPDPLFNPKVLHDIIKNKKVKEQYHDNSKSNQFYHSVMYGTNDEEVIILLTNITEKMKTIEILRRSESRLQKIYKNLPVGIEIYDSNGYLVDVNDRIIEIFGFENRMDCLGINLFQNTYFSSEQLKDLQNGKELNVNITYRFTKDDRGYHRSKKNYGYKKLTIKGTCFHDAEYNIESYLLIIIDYTDTYEAFKKIHEFEILFNEISELAKIGIFQWNVLPNKLYTSKEWYLNLNIKPHLVNDISEFYVNIHPDDLDSLMAFFDDAIEDKVRVFENEIRVKDGNSWKWLKTKFKVNEYNPQLNIIEIIGLNLDITALKLTEQQLIESKIKAEESDRLKSAFLANMSHEIRTPLNAIVGFSSLLLEAQSTEEVQLYTTIINKNNDLLLQLVSDILDLSKIESGILETNYSNIDVRVLCEELLYVYQLEVSEKVKLVLNSGHPVCFIYSDRNKIIQVLSNFISNAIKFTETGKIELGYHITDNNIIFYVEDTGIGIRNDELNSIFDRFTKLNSFIRGTGLGLPICKGIVDKLGGEIFVESVYGKGSKFSIKLPHIVIKDKISDNLPHSSNVAIDTIETKKKILVAEDIDSNYKLFYEILRKEFTVIRASNGKEAIDMNEHIHPDLIIMDIRMPIMGGLEAIKELRSTYPELVVIAVTAFAYETDKRNFLNAGFNDYIAKPIVPSKLIEVIHKYI